MELSIPILSSLKAHLAGRLDKYDDVTAVDDAKTWNAGLEWRPLDSLLLRGSYSTSFRAPAGGFLRRPLPREWCGPRAPRSSVTNLV